MITRKHQSTGVTSRGFSTGQNPVVIRDSVVPFVLTYTSSEEVIENDIVYDVTTGASWVNNTWLDVRCPITPAYTSSDPGVAVVDDLGKITYVGEGHTTVTADCGVYGKITRGVTMTISHDAVVSTFVRLVDGSLNKTITDTMDAAITGKDAGDIPIFSLQDHATSTYERNPDCWAAQWHQQLTCCSPWNSRGGSKRAGVLITPRHIVHAAHYPIYVGDTLRFVEVDGTTHTRTVTQAANHPDYVPYFPDIRVSLLDSDLPAGISFCKIMPDTSPYITDIKNRRVLSLVMDQQEHALMHAMYEDSNFRAFVRPSEAEYRVFSEDIISGDSGNPSFMVVDDELCLLTVWTYGGGGAGTSLDNYVDDIDQMILDLDTEAGDLTGYTCTVKDLSAYPSYT